jgi:hypothetical protein
MSADNAGQLDGTWWSRWQTNSKDDRHSWSTEKVTLKYSPPTAIELGTVAGTNNNGYEWEGRGRIIKKEVRLQPFSVIRAGSGGN